MDNKEIIAKIDEILKTKNFLDMYEQMAMFEKDYVKTAFYKQYKVKLLELIKMYKQFDILNLEKMFKTLQVGIDSLDFSNLNNVLDEFSKQVQVDNEELKSSLGKIKDILGLNPNSAE
jgi:hypothetical protein